MISVVAGAAAAAIAGSAEAMQALLAPAAMTGGCCVAAWLECEVRSNRELAWRTLAEGSVWRAGTLLAAAAAAIF